MGLLDGVSSIRKTVKTEDAKKSEEKEQEETKPEEIDVFGDDIDQDGVGDKIELNHDNLEEDENGYYVEVGKDGNDSLNKINKNSYNNWDKMSKDEQEQLLNAAMDANSDIYGYSGSDVSNQYVNADDPEHVHVGTVIATPHGTQEFVYEPNDDTATLSNGKDGIKTLSDVVDEYFDEETDDQLKYAIALDQAKANSDLVLERINMQLNSTYDDVAEIPKDILLSANIYSDEVGADNELKIVQSRYEDFAEDSDLTSVRYVDKELYTSDMSNVTIDPNYEGENGDLVDGYPVYKSVEDAILANYKTDIPADEIDDLGEPSSSTTDENGNIKEEYENGAVVIRDPETNEVISAKKPVEKDTDAYAVIMDGLKDNSLNSQVVEGLSGQDAIDALNNISEATTLNLQPTEIQRIAVGYDEETAKLAFAQGKDTEFSYLHSTVAEAYMNAKDENGEYKYQTMLDLMEFYSDPSDEAAQNGKSLLDRYNENPDDPETQALIAAAVQNIISNNDFFKNSTFEINGEEVAGKDLTVQQALQLNLIGEDGKPVVEKMKLGDAAYNITSPQEPVKASVQKPQVNDDLDEENKLPEVDTDTDIDTDTDSDTDIDTDTDTDIDTDTDSDTDIDTDTDSDTDIDTDTDTDIDTDTDSDTDIDTDTDTDIDTDTDSDTDIDTDTDTDIDIENPEHPSLDTDTDTDTDIDTDTDTDIGVDTDTDSDTDVSMDTDTDTDIDIENPGHPSLDTDTDSDTDVSMDTDTDTDIDTDTDTDIGVDTDTDSDTDVSMDTDTDTDIDIENPGHPSLDTDTDSDTDVSMDTDTDTDIDTDTDTDIGVDTDTDSDTDVSMDTDTDTDIDIENPGHPSLDTDTDSDTDVSMDTDTDTGTDIDIENPGHPSLDTDTDSGTDVSVDTDTDTGTDIDIENPGHPSLDTDTDSGTDVSVDTDTDTGTNIDTDTDTNIGVDTDTDTGTDIDTDTDDNEKDDPGCEDAPSVNDPEDPFTSGS